MTATKTATATRGAKVWRPPRPTAAIVLRSVVFTVFTYGLLVVLAVLGAPLLLGSRRDAARVVRVWARATLWALRMICGVRVEFRGREHLTSGAMVIAAKHLSMLDTVAPLLVLDDPAFVLKQELMRLPFFGWYAAKLGMLPIDRAGAASALRTLIQGARERLAAGRQLLIFPEGTRRLPGAPGDYKPGVAGLYRELGCGCTPLATNSGLHWPAHGFLRYPGVVVFEFLPPIPPGLRRGPFMATLETTIDGATLRLIAEDASDRPFGRASSLLDRLDAHE